MGQGLRIPGEVEIAALTIHSGADAEGQVSFSISNPKWQNPAPHRIDVRAGESGEEIAKKIARVWVNGFRKRIKGSTVTFTAMHKNAYTITFDPGASSVKGTVQTIADGSPDLVARITEIQGARITLAGKTLTARTDKTVFHDDTEAIQSAIKAAEDEQVIYVPAGAYRISRGLNVGAGGQRITLRGAGPEKTVLVEHNASGISIGDRGGADYRWQWPNVSITGNPSRGATVLQAAVGTVPVGALCQVSVKNDRSLPVCSHTNWDYLRRQKCRIVAKTAATVTISPPLLFDLPGALDPKINAATKHAEFCGIEDLAVDGTHSSAHKLIGIDQGYGCWVKNVKVTHAAHYVFGVSSSLFCAVRHCIIGKRKKPFGPNGGSLLFGGSTGCLIVDNILVETFPHMEINGGASGNVFAYNFCDDSGVMAGLLGCTINTNHGPHNSYNLYEGNVGPKLQCDGYHGSASHDTMFRNWFHGTSRETKNFWICVNLNRFTRNYSVVGNVLGREGHTWLYDNDEHGFGYNQHFIYVLGMPNMGNGGYRGGKVQPSKGKYWADWNRLIASPRGKGPGPNGFQEIDLDVAATTILRGNYNYRDNRVPASESLEGATLPRSLYLSEKPGWFDDLAWPPFGPDADFEKNNIPAQVRYERIADAEKGPR